MLQQKAKINNIIATEMSKIKAFKKKKSTGCQKNYLKIILINA